MGQPAFLASSPTISTITPSHVYFVLVIASTTSLSRNVSPVRRASPISMDSLVLLVPTTPSGMQPQDYVSPALVVRFLSMEPVNVQPGYSGTVASVSTALCLSILITVRRPVFTVQTGKFMTQ